MSGGSYDYAYSQLEMNFVDALRIHSWHYETQAIKRQAFKEHLRLVVRAMKAIEWNDSGDGDDHEEALIDAIISRQDVLNVATANAQAAYDQLGKVLSDG